MIRSTGLSHIDHRVDAMLPTVLTASLLIAIVLNGLLAGLFFAFSIAIIPGLRRVDDSTYVRSFRAINAGILNPVFLLIFCLAPLSAVAFEARWNRWNHVLEPHEHRSSCLLHNRNGVRVDQLAPFTSFATRESLHVRARQ